MQSQPGQVVDNSNNLELKGFRDWKNGLTVVKESIIKQPVLAVLLFVVLLIDELGETFQHKIPAITLVELFIAVNMSYPIMRSVYLELSANASSPPEKIEGSMSGRLFSVAFLYNLLTALLGLLLIIPGIWWSIRSSLAAVFACVEGKNPMDSLKASHKLVAGNFGLTASYLLLFPGLIIAGIFAIYFLVAVICGLAFPQLFSDQQSGTSITKVLLEIIPYLSWGMVIYIWMLSLFPLMVRLYVYLKAKKKMNEVVES